jgi:hypothetical protein
MRRKPCLLTLAIFTLILVGAIVWLLRTEHVTLTAKPGETISVNDVPAISAHRAFINGVDSPIAWEEYLGRGLNGYRCYGGTVLVTRNDSDGVHDVTLKNDCTETVTIEIWWYSFRVLNIFLDGYY